MEQFLSNMIGNIIGATIGTVIALIAYRYSNIYDKVKSQSDKELKIAQDMLKANPSDKQCQLVMEKALNRWAEFDEISNLKHFHPGLKGIWLSIKTCFSHK